MLTCMIGQDQFFSLHKIEIQVCFWIMRQNLNKKFYGK
jgi:hypothetical protein